MNFKTSIFKVRKGAGGYSSWSPSFFSYFPKNKTFCTLYHNQNYNAFNWCTQKLWDRCGTFGTPCRIVLSRVSFTLLWFSFKIKFYILMWYEVAILDRYLSIFSCIYNISTVVPLIYFRLYCRSVSRTVGLSVPDSRSVCPGHLSKRAKTMKLENYQSNDFDSGVVRVGTILRATYYTYRSGVI